jgi:hypothetical protein
MQYGTASKEGGGAGGKESYVRELDKLVNDAKILFLFSTLIVTFKINLFHACLG